MEYLFKILNSFCLVKNINFINLISVLGTGLITYLIVMKVEKYKFELRRRYSIKLLKTELERQKLTLTEESKNKKDVIEFGIPYYNDIYIQTILNSGALDINKDSELIQQLLQTYGWTSTFNSLNNITNLEVVAHGAKRKEVFDELKIHRREVGAKTKEAFDELKKLIESKY